MRTSLHIFVLLGVGVSFVSAFAAAICVTHTQVSHTHTHTLPFTDVSHTYSHLTPQIRASGSRCVVRERVGSGDLRHTHTHVSHTHTQLTSQMYHTHTHTSFPRFALLGVGVSFVSALAVAICIFVLRHQIARMYTSNEAISDTATGLMASLSVLVTFNAINCTIQVCVRVSGGGEGGGMCVSCRPYVCYFF